jgi:micrococcal nuclease
VRHRSRKVTIAVVAVATCAAAVRGQQPTSADAAKVSAWATGGTSATAKPTDPDGKPNATQPPQGMPYWQAPALPAAVIQGGTIPPGWQPQAVPYQGIGPDGRVVTQYFAPTYTFTYQVGPPVLAVPQPSTVTRRQPPVYRSPQLYGTAPAPYAAGWNYQPQALPPPPAPAVVRYAPPAPVPAPATPPAAAPAGWMPATAPPPPPATISAPPTAWAAAAVPAAATAAAINAPAPAAAVPPMQSVSVPPPTVPVSRSQLWRVVGVQDGDTVTCLDDLNQQRKVALADIDAPEIGQAYGKASREALAGMVFGRTVEVVDAGTMGGVPAARLYVDGVDVSRQMIATGNAWQDPGSQDRSLAADQTQARGAGLGLWADPTPSPPWESQR